MRNRFFEAILGALVLVVAAGFAGMTFQHLRADERTAEYELTARFQTIGGLALGADVRIGGIKIGEVRQRTIDPEFFEAVITFSVREDLRLPDDSTVEIQSSGLLGEQYVLITPGASQGTVDPGAELTMTESPQSLEDLLSRAIFILSEK